MDAPNDRAEEPGFEDRLARVEAALSSRESAKQSGAVVDRVLKYLPVFAFSNLLVAAPAFLISITVAYFTFVQAEATEKMQIASVWPHVAYETSNQSEDGEQMISLALTNQGVGPARIDGLQISYRDKPYTSLRDILAACCTDDPMNLSIGMGSINGEVVRPGERVVFAQVEPDKVPADVWERFNRERLTLHVQVCYCSVFDDCWVADWNSANAQPVKECPMNWTQYFGFPQAEPAPR